MHAICNDCKADLLIYLLVLSKCAGDLICFQRSGTETPSVPGCAGNASNFPSEDFCIRRSSPEFVLDQLEYVGDNGYPEAAFPLHECQGDCDSDSQVRRHGL